VLNNQDEKELRWKRVDETDWLAHCEEKARHNLYYGRTYTTGQGYSYSETNNLIINLKILPNEENRLRHKKRAIQSFIDETKFFFEEIFCP
jgi:hypothetical protein